MRKQQTEVDNDSGGNVTNTSDNAVFICRVANIAPGMHHFRFIVDGQWKTDPQLNMVSDGNGYIHNMVEVSYDPKEDSILGGKGIDYAIL
jgi:hypothetical protein